jgi:SAM-dependent methyltransferase
VDAPDVPVCGDANGEDRLDGSLLPVVNDGVNRSARLAREIVKDSVAALPAGRRLLELRRRRSPYAPHTHAPDYPRGVFGYQAELIAEHRPLSGRLLEIGPGANLGVSALFAANGFDEVVAIDIDRWLVPSDALYQELGVTAALDRVRYVSPLSIESADFPDGSFDAVVSHASAEYFVDPDAAVRNIARMLAPGGVSIHHIRVLGHWSVARPHDFLRVGERAWRLATSHRSGQPNRWRISDWLDAFTRSDAPPVEVDVRKRVPISAEERERLAPRFRAKTLDDLAIYNARVVCVRERM